MVKWRVVATRNAEIIQSQWSDAGDDDSRRAVLLANRDRLPDWDVRLEFADDVVWPEYLEEVA